MVLKISVLPEQWAIATGDFSRDNFNDYARGIIATQLTKYEDCDKTVLVLPNTATKGQRYNIHRLTLKNDFEAFSHDAQNGDRIMQISLSKKYIQELFENYPFMVPQFQLPPLPKTDKQLLFESMITFINQNLANEFQQYLNTI
jgi:hypothetical protein